MELGFKVEIMNPFAQSGTPDLTSSLHDRTNKKVLHGVYFWGHGIYTRSGKNRKKIYVGLKTENEEVFNDMRLNSDNGISYRLGLVLLYACGTEAGSSILGSHAPGYLEYVKKGTLWPVLPWSFYLEHVITPGQQGTKRKDK